MKRLLLLVLFVLTPTIAAADDIDKYLELLRSDFRTTKTQIHTEGLKMTTAEADKFWPIQRAYEAELAKIGDQRVQLIKDYAAKYDSMDATSAKQLVDRAFKLENARLSLLKKYTDKVGKEVSPLVAARFAQLEAIINSLIDLQIRASTPLVP